MGQRRDEIVEIARNLFASGGIRNTSMRDLANAAGVTPSSLYSHFSSKDALVDEIIEGYATYLITECRRLEREIDDPVERLRELIRLGMSLLDRYPQELAIHQRDGEYLATLPAFSYFAELRTAVRESWLRSIEQAMTQGQFRNDIRPDVLYRWLRDAVFYSFTWWGRDTEQISTVELGDQAASLFLDGLLKGARSDDSSV